MYSIGQRGNQSLHYWSHWWYIPFGSCIGDGIFEKQTANRFKSVSQVKLSGAYNLDKYASDYMPMTTSYFVVFSSVTSGRGNMGQTNYGYANSAMERVCEERKRQGKHALAIQWGAIGEVGLIAESSHFAKQQDDEIVVGGTVPQKIASCLKTL